MIIITPTRSYTTLSHFLVIEVELTCVYDYAMIHLAVIIGEFSYARYLLTLPNEDGTSSVLRTEFNNKLTNFQLANELEYARK